LTPQLGLFLSSIAFVGTHFLLSHPLRAPLVRRVGENAFGGIYVVVAFITFGAMIYFYRIIGREPPLWTPTTAVWLIASVLMWFGAILFVGSFVRNPALPRARLAPGTRPHGVFAITRHPMMWGFAIWGAVHLAIVGMPKSLVFDGAIIFLALVGAAGQDRRKAESMGEAWHEWSAQTAFIPFARGVAHPGVVAFVGGTLLFFLATWVHPVPAGFWRWIG
jgi:uncharacterized membrane protein